MNNLERFWLDLIDTRKHTIREVYGAEAAERYHPHSIEKEYFLQHGGQFTAHPYVTKHTEEFFKMCEIRYEIQKANHMRVLQQRWANVQDMPEYKRSMRERKELTEQIKRAILAGNGKEETNNGVHARPNEKEG